MSNNKEGFECSKMALEYAEQKVKDTDKVVHIFYSFVSKKFIVCARKYLSHSVHVETIRGC